MSAYEIEIIDEADDDAEWREFHVTGPGVEEMVLTRPDGVGAVEFEARLRAALDVLAGNSGDDLRRAWSAAAVNMRAIEDQGHTYWWILGVEEGKRWDMICDLRRALGDGEGLPTTWDGLMQLIRDGIVGGA